MKSKEFITTVDKSLLTKQEVRLKTLFKRNPKLTVEQALIVLDNRKEVLKPKLFNSPKPEIKPIIVEPIEPVVMDKPKSKPKAKPKAKEK